MEERSHESERSESEGMIERERGRELREVKVRRMREKERRGEEEWRCILKTRTPHLGCGEKQRLSICKI